MRFTIFLLLIIALMFVGGCGDDDDDDSTSGTSPDDDDAIADDDDIIDDDDSVSDDDDAASDDDDNIDDDDFADDDDTIDDDDTVDDDDALDDDDDSFPPPSPDYDMDFEGFGADTTGGEGGEELIVTNVNDSGPGSLRDILAGITGPAIVRFAVDGTIEAQHFFEIPSDITIDARGHNITIKNNGFRIDGKSNIIVMNVAFQDVSGEIGDCFQIMNGAHDIVIFHCSFDNAGLMPFIPDIPDEQISIIFGSYNITISWCRFANHDKVLLIGNGDAPQAVDEVIAVTMHHNVFYNTGRRHPFLRFGRVDMYNNIIHQVTKYLEFPYGSRSQELAQILSERNWYDFTSHYFCIGAYHKLGGKMRLVDNEVTESWIVMMENKPDEVFQRPYAATIHRIDDNWKTMMDNHTGNTMPAP